MTTTDTKSFAVKATIVMTLAAATVVALYLLGHLAQMLLVVFGGILFGVLLDGLTHQLAKRTRLPRALSLTIVIAVLLLLLTGVILFAGPKLVDQFATLAKRIPAAVDEIRTSLSQYEWGQRLLESLGTASGSMPKGSELLGQVGGVFSTAAGAVSAVIVIFFTGIYLAADPYLYSRNLELLLPKRHRQRARELLESIGTALKWWLTGRFSSMAVVGILTSVGLWITGVPLAFPLGLLAAILSFVPFIGPIAWVIPASLVALAESPELIVWVLTVYLAVQLLESYVITPLIQQRAVRIPPALLIVMQILMTVLFGIMGTLFATPLAVTAIVVVQILYVEGVLGEDVSIMGDHRR